MMGSEITKSEGLAVVRGPHSLHRAMVLGLWAVDLNNSWPINDGIKFC